VQMIYICIPSFDESQTVGLVLWKVRRVFEELGREYQIVLGDDGSTDATAEVLEPYKKVLPLTVIRTEHQGYARTIQEILSHSLHRSDRPKRDCAVLLHADFAHGPEFIPGLVRRIESGADLVIAEGTLTGEPSRGRRLVRRIAPWLLARGVAIPGVHDTVSGFLAFRLITLHHALRGPRGPTLASDGWGANAELLARAAQHARRIETVAVVERHDRRRRTSRVRPWTQVRELWRAARVIRQSLARSGASLRAKRAGSEAPA